MKRRTIVLILALCLIAALFAGCKKAEPVEETTTKETVKETKATEEAKPTEEPEKELEPVELKWVLRGSEPVNLESVEAAANAISQEKINATVVYQFVEKADYNQSMSMMMAAAEVFDLCFTSSWANKYEAAVMKGGYEPLNDLMPEYAPKTFELLDKYLAATEINGVRYGIPSYQLLYEQPGFMFRKDLVDKYSIDLSNVKSLYDLTPILQTIKDNEADVSPIVKGQALPADVFIDTVTSYVSVDSDTWKAYDINTSDDVINNYKLMYEWNQKGFFPADIATLTDTSELMGAGKAFAMYVRYSPGTEVSLKATHGYDFEVVPFGDPIINRYGVQSAMTAISKTSLDPARAMMLFEIMNNDVEYFNIMAFGLEGQDYNFIGENRIEVIPDMYKVSCYEFGNQLNKYLLPEEDENLRPQTHELNEVAKVSHLADFNFIPDSIETEIAQVNAVADEFKGILTNGLADPDEVLPEFAEKMELAGLGTIIEEVQAQIDAWKSGN